MKQAHSGPMAGRTVLVTGATAGIGKATAAGLATMGAHLALGAPRTRPGRSAQPAVGRSTCSSPTCPLRQR
jgi:retinol dehydrogenase-14